MLTPATYYGHSIQLRKFLLNFEFDSSMVACIFAHINMITMKCCISQSNIAGLVCEKFYRDPISFLNYSDKNFHQMLYFIKQAIISGTGPYGVLIQ